MNATNKYLVEEYRGRINRVMDYIEKFMDGPMHVVDICVPVKPM